MYRVKSEFQIKDGFWDTKIRSIFFKTYSEYEIINYKDKLKENKNTEDFFMSDLIEALDEIEIEILQSHDLNIVYITSINHTTKEDMCNFINYCTSKYGNEVIIITRFPIEKPVQNLQDRDFYYNLGFVSVNKRCNFDNSDPVIYNGGGIITERLINIMNS